MTFPDGRSELPARWKVRRTRAFEDGVTAKATEILEQNIQGGTGTKARSAARPAGKTGTTDEFTDAWFVGFTPRLATAVWVGYPKDRTQMLGLYYGANVAGGTFPAEIWGTYMKQAKGKFCGDFQPPKTPFSSQPFFGKYATLGRRQGRRAEGGDDDRPDAAPRRRSRRHARGGRPDGHGRRRASPTRHAAATTRASTPTKYEAPPQPPPGDGGNGNGDGGTATAAARRRRAETLRRGGAAAGITRACQCRVVRREACGKAVPGSTTSRIRTVVRRCWDWLPVS